MQATVRPTQSRTHVGDSGTYMLVSSSAQDIVTTIAVINLFLAGFRLQSKVSVF